jgi:hypothetical protein
MHLANRLTVPGLALLCLLGSAAPRAQAGEAAKVTTVIAEGLGKTADDALKDAFRDAVRQVVGAVVDAETRIKNDEVISDKVLTASSGFVASYEKLKLTEDNGLFRIKIKAKVEEAEVVERLHKFKINTLKVKASDVLPPEKEQRFSDARIKEMTKEDMVKNKTEILHDVLGDLPKVLEARCKAPDRFDYDEKSGTLKLQVLVGGDEASYAQFLKRLGTRLEKLSVGKGFTVTKAKKMDLGGHYHPSLTGVRGFMVEEAQALLGPDLSKQAAEDVWCLWVLTQTFESGTSLRWTGYLLDADVRKCLTGLRGELKVQIAVRDAQGKVMVEEILDLKEEAWLGNVSVRYKKTGHTSGDVTSILAPAPATVQVTEEKTVNVLLAPMQFWPYWAATPGNGAFAMPYVAIHPYPVTVRISREEVDRLHDIRCTVLFKPTP